LEPFDSVQAIASVFENLKQLIEKSSSASKSEQLDVIDSEAKKQKHELQMAHAQAKVAQELAIAQRIENAKEVVIEEYYGEEVQGKAGVDVAATGVTIEAGGEGRRVTKRVYRFIGEGKGSTDTQREPVTIIPDD